MDIPHDEMMHESQTAATCQSTTANGTANTYITPPYPDQHQHPVDEYHNDTAHGRTTLGQEDDTKMQSPKDAQEQADSETINKKCNATRCRLLESREYVLSREGHIKHRIAAGMAQLEEIFDFCKKLEAMLQDEKKAFRKDSQI